MKERVPIIETIKSLVPIRRKAKMMQIFKAGLERRKYEKKMEAKS